MAGRSVLNVLHCYNAAARSTHGDSLTLLRLGSPSRNIFMESGFVLHRETQRFCIEKHKDACGIPYFDRYAANGRTRRTHPVLLIRPTRGEYYEHRRAHSTPIDSLNAWVQELRVAYSIRPLSGECVFVTMHARQMLLHPFGPHRPHEEVECVPTVSDR